MDTAGPPQGTFGPGLGPVAHARLAAQSLAERPQQNLRSAALTSITPVE